MSTGRQRSELTPAPRPSFTVVELARTSVRGHRSTLRGRS
jgi:hypothetical protein